MNGPERYGMTPGEMCYLVSRAAAMHEVRTGERPDAIMLSRDLYDVMVRSFLITAHLVQNAEMIGSEERLFGMKLKVNPLQNGMKFFLGTEYDLNEMSGNRSERDEQIHDHREPGAGS